MSLHSRIARRPRRRRRRAAPGRGSPRAGGVDRHDVERLLGRRRGRDLVAGVAQDHPQRAQDLRLVVADQHPPARAAHSARSIGSAAGASTGTASWIDEARPLTGQRLGADAAAVGLDEAPCDRQPESRPRRRSRPSGGTARRRAPAPPGGIPGPWSEIRRTTSRPDARPRIVTGSSPAKPDGVLEHVRQRALELCGVRLDQRQVVVEIDGEAGVRRRSRVDRRAHQLLDRAPVDVGVRPHRPGASRGRAGSGPAAPAARSRSR